MSRRYSQVARTGNRTVVDKLYRMIIEEMQDTGATEMLHRKNGGMVRPVDPTAFMLPLTLTTGLTSICC